MERLFDCLQRIFPSDAAGEAVARLSPYIAWPTQDGGTPDAYATPPIMPADVFAAAGYVLLHHHVIPQVADRTGRAARQIEVDEEFISTARATAKAWRAFRPSIHYSDSDPSVFAKWLATDGAALASLRECDRRIAVDCLAPPRAQQNDEGLCTTAADPDAKLFKRAIPQRGRATLWRLGSSHQ
ncbi:hypothetical protein [Bradyrhizobium glycinis]|uniref:hypothetical protein n=1 Tax=Bradyrhizobium glycinis TaxID=2751812 RepID=UPI0018D80F01|nr:hypothetical protein [Bradyrhizobium glycinis]MBH5371556.1 hypothetical protein [Bradyrhizobium glycinis]